MAVDSKLTSTLREAQKKPMFFAFIAKGTDGKLLADKRKIPPGEVTEAKKSCGGGTVFLGRCQGEEGTLVFEVGKEPPGTLATLIKKIIKQDAGLTVAVEVRFAVDLSAEEAAPAAAAVPLAPAAPPPPPAAPPVQAAPAAGAHRFAARLKVLAPIAQKLAATGAPQAVQACSKIGEANTAFRTKAYDQANSLLDQAEALLKQVPPPNAAAQQAPPAAQADVSLMKLGKARVEWIATRGKAKQEMQRLQTALREKYKDDPAEKAVLASALTELDAVFDELNEELGNELDLVVNAAGPQRRALAKEAGATVARFLQFIDTDDLMKLMDGNEVLPDMQVAAPLRAKLQDIAATLG